MLLDEIALATARLADAGVPSPRTDAEELAAFVHGVRSGELHTVPDADFDARFWEGVARREAREPLQHITGRAFFRYLELEVGPGRVRAAPGDRGRGRLGHRDAARRWTSPTPLVVDLGTGSGAIALAIAQEVALAAVHAVEVDPEAYSWAKRNIAEHGQGRIHLHPDDLADALPELDGQVDLVISNPPYIPPGAIAARPRGPRLRPRRAPCTAPATTASTRSAPSSAPPAGCCAPAAGSPSSTPTRRAAPVYWIFPEEHGWRDVRHRQDLTAQGPLRHRPARRTRTERHGTRDDCAAMENGCREPHAMTAPTRASATGRDREAASAVRRGELVVLPTDTVYGIGADAFTPAAVTALLEAKGRGRDMPPPVLVGTVRAASALVEDFGPYGQDLVDAFWPGPLTLVCRASRALSWDLGDTKGTVAVRMPLHPVALDLLKETGPMAVSSANRSGAPPAARPRRPRSSSATPSRSTSTAADRPTARPSTIVDLTTAVPRLLRAARSPSEKLRGIIGYVATDE